jgi:integrase
MAVKEKNNAWYVIIAYTDSLGKKKHKWIHTDAKSEAAARKIERRMLTDLERGNLIFTPKQTFGDFLDQWMKEHVKNEAEIGTIKKYEAHIKTIKAAIGDVLLDKLNGLNVQQFLNSARQNGASGTYLYDMYATVKRALNIAVKWGLIVKNPAAAIDPPKKSKPTQKALTPEQVEILLLIVKDTEIYLPVLLGLLCGLRRGEICGLRWPDVDTKKKSAHICNSLDVHDGEYILGPVKTDTSDDFIPLPEMVVTELRRERIRQKRNKMELGDNYAVKSVEKEGYCWSWEDGKPHNPDYIYHKMKKLITAHNKAVDADKELSERQKEARKLPSIRVHDLRHTHATLLLRAHVDTKVVSKKLRHTDYRFTAQMYQHVHDDIQRETANVMDEMFKKTKG